MSVGRIVLVLAMTLVSSGLPSCEVREQEASSRADITTRPAHRELPIAVGAGNNATCVATLEGIRCWGDIVSRPIPSVHNVRELGVTYARSCAIADEGVRCWGYGDGDSLQPPAVVAPSKLTVDGDVSCVLDEGRVKCWGDQNRTQVPSFTHPTAVDANRFQDCAVDDGRVRCWAPNGFAPFSNATFSTVSRMAVGDSLLCVVDDGDLKCVDSNMRQAAGVPVMHDVKGLVAGGYFTCALGDDRVQCVRYNHWGSDDGQLNVPRLTHPRQLAAGQDHACAVDAYGVKCWGKNDSGQTNVPFDLEVIGRHACVRSADGGVRCAGQNERGQLGFGDDADHFESLANAAPVDFGADFGEVTKVAVAQRFTCALGARGGVKCWGANDAGQLGLGDDRDQGTPSAPLVFGGAPIVRLAANGRHACAIDADGALFCWGAGDRGQLGDGENVDRISPVRVALPALAREVALAMESTCVLGADAKVYCFGANDHGQLGTGEAGDAARPATPVALGASFEPKSLAAGAEHACAVSSRGLVACWGRNDHGQLALGDTQDHRNASALAVADLGHGQAVSEVQCGLHHCCAKMVQNAMKCWGANERGQLGLGDRKDRGTTPGSIGDELMFVQTPSGEAISALDVVDNRTCTRTASGLRCWGRNGGGELGYGDRTDRGGTFATVPRALPALGL